MPSCTVCGEDEFEARDGLFFCTMCMTQSQDLRQEEAAEEMVDISAFGMHAIRDKKQQNKERKQKRDKGRPWSCYEGFQIIIKEQVKALIRLGADPKLKDVVFQLWCTYLAKINVAFTKDLEKTDPLLIKFERHREKYPGTVDNPDIEPVNLRRILKRTSTPSAAAAKASIENQELQFSLRGEEFYDEDNPFNCDQEKLVADEELDVDMDDDSDSEDDDQTSAHMTRRLYVRHPGFMNMKKTLVFCHLGLMYTNPVTTAVDIVRWTHENEIPYEKASNLLPSDMKFGPYDCNTFHASLPVSEEKLRQTSGQMINYLDLEDIPMPPIKDLINKYLVILELPGDLHGFVHKIEELTEYVKHFKRIYLPSFDSIAMAFIIVTLEILIGLDGKTERKLSKISKKMEALIPGVRLFVWDDWVCHTNKKQKLTLTHLMSKTFDMRVLENVEQVTTSVRHAQRRGDRRTEKQLSKKFQESSQNALLLPLKMLSEKEESAVLSYNNTTICDPEEDTIDNVVSTSEETTNQVPETRSHDNKSFRTCRLKHITQPRHFLNLLNKEWRLSQETHTECHNTGGENSDVINNREDAAENTAENTDINDTSDDRTESRTRASKSANDSRDVTPLTVDNSVINDSTEDSDTNDNGEPIKVTDYELYDPLIDKIEQIFIERQLDRNFGRKCLVTGSSSYRWLVHKCAVLGETSDADLNGHVNGIQTALIKSFPRKKRYLYYYEGFVAFIYDLIYNSKLLNE